MESLCIQIPSCINQSDLGFLTFVIQRGGERVGEIEIGTDIYTLLCIKQITNENLLYSTGNSTQCSVVT